jgi:hypothetical protein
MIIAEWILNQANAVKFCLVDASYAEVAGLGGTYTLELSKIDGAFVGSAGVKTETSDGWYQYIGTAAEADTIGPLAIKVTGVGIIQQNLVVNVKQANPGAVPYTYTALDSGTGLPIPGVQIWVSTDAAGNHVIWTGFTDAFGVARDASDNLPYLDPGVYAFWKQRVGYIDDDNPDTEVVS